MNRKTMYMYFWCAVPGLACPHTITGQFKILYVKDDMLLFTYMTATDAVRRMTIKNTDERMTQTNK